MTFLRLSIGIGIVATGLIGPTRSQYTNSKGIVALSSGFWLYLWHICLEYTCCTHSVVDLKLAYHPPGFLICAGPMILYHSNKEQPLFFEEEILLRSYKWPFLLDLKIFAIECF